MATTTKSNVAVHGPADEGQHQHWRQINAAVAEADAGPPASSLPPAEVPEVDISCFAVPGASGAETEREAVVCQVLAAAKGAGFMNVVGHGVPQAVIDAALSALTSFFRTPLEEKQRCMAQSMNGTHRGHMSYKSFNMNAVLDRPGPANLRETYSFGPAEHMGGSEYGANTYPDFIDDFQHCIDDYYAEMEHLEKLMLDIFTLALAKSTGRPLDPQYLSECIKPNRGLMKACWYPVCEPSWDDTRCAAHTDWGPLTFLLTTSQGLEVCQRSQEGRYQWRAVPVVPGAFTINVADQLARWSNDRFVSCIHQVNANVSCHTSRISIPYFPAQIFPISKAAEPKVESICAEGEEPKYEPLSVRDYLQRNFSKGHVNNGGGHASKGGA
jgi:isopenicillin N synthase-like dioxygenase